jgi:hypothetical protein
MSVLAVAGRELRGLFVTPFGWIALAVMQFVAAWLFLVQLEGFVQLQARLAAVAGAPGVTDLVVAPALAQVGVLLLLVMPLVSMRAISGERQAGTLQLLLAAPLSAGSRQASGRHARPGAAGRYARRDRVAAVDPGHSARRGRGRDLRPVAAVVGR